MVKLNLGKYKELISTPHTPIKSEYRFFKFIEKYVRTRIFDMKTFKMDMEVIINTVDLDKLPAYKRLLTEEYWKIPDDQFAPAMDVILNNVKNGELELIDIVKNNAEEFVWHA